MTHIRKLKKLFGKSNQSFFRNNPAAALHTFFRCLSNQLPIWPGGYDMKDIYERLRDRLDTLSTGFPSTEDGIEMDTLKTIFTPEDGELYLTLSQMPEKSTDIVEKIQKNANDTEKQLADMATKGLLFKLQQGQDTFYFTPPFTMGIMEFQVGKVGDEFAELTEAYYQSGFGKTLQANSTVLKRTIQINDEIVTQSPVIPYNNAKEIIDSEETIAIAPCVCREMGRINETGCAKPLEACISFGVIAEYYVQLGAGRFIEKEEAHRFLKQFDEAGLVIQVSNSQSPGSMCACCSCCCIMIRSLKMQSNPAERSGSNYYVENNPDECSGCEVCIERCQMDAMEIEDGIPFLKQDRCIGCGLCVTTCTTESLKLVLKQQDQIYKPPANDFEMYMKIQKERGL